MDGAYRYAKKSISFDILAIFIEKDCWFLSSERKEILCILISQRSWSSSADRMRFGHSACRAMLVPDAIQLCPRYASDVLYLRNSVQSLMAKTYGSHF